MQTITTLTFSINVSLSIIHSSVIVLARASMHDDEYFFVLIAATGHEMQRMINTHVEASKIGSHIAEQVLDYQRQINNSSGNNLTLNHF